MANEPVKKLTPMQNALSLGAFLGLIGLAVVLGLSGVDLHSKRWFRISIQCIYLAGWLAAGISCGARAIIAWRARRRAVDRRAYRRCLCIAFCCGFIALAAILLALVPLHRMGLMCGW